MMKRMIAMLLALLLSFSLLAGCGKKETDSTSSDGEIVLKMWTIATEGDANRQAFMSAIADYEAAHPNIKIEMEAFENESYKTKLKTAVAGNELPDIYFTWGGGFSSSFVEAGKSLDLTSYYEDYKDELPEGVLKYATYNDKIYGVPYIVSISGIFYNKAMFAEYNLQEPKTWDELINVCQTFIDNGITPFGTSVKEAWVLAMFHDALALKCSGNEKLNDAFSGNGVSYSDEAFVDAANKMKTLIDMGAFSESAAGLSNDEAVASFINGTYPMFVTGAWLSNSLTSAENAADFDVMAFPACSSNAAITDNMGGAQDELMVNPGTKYQDEAANAAFEIARSVSKYGAQTGAGITAWVSDGEIENQSALDAKLTKLVNESTSLTVWSGTLMTGEDYTEYQSLLQQFFIGDIDADGFVKAMDHVLAN